MLEMEDHKEDLAWTAWHSMYVGALVPLVKLGT